MHFNQAFCAGSKLWGLLKVSVTGMVMVNGTPGTNEATSLPATPLQLPQPLRDHNVRPTNVSHRALWW